MESATCQQLCSLQSNIIHDLLLSFAKGRGQIHHHSEIFGVSAKICPHCAWTNLGIPKNANSPSMTSRAFNQKVDKDDMD